MHKNISWRFRKARRNFFPQIRRPAFLYLKDIIKFNTRETYLEGSTAKFNTRETQKFRGFLEPRNLVPAKFSTFQVQASIFFLLIVEV